MEVYLTENLCGHGREVYGIFSNPEKARQVCQEVANGYFGEKLTKPLTWNGNDGYQSASHYDPGGQYMFAITRLTVDDVTIP